MMNTHAEFVDFFLRNFSILGCEREPLIHICIRLIIVKKQKLNKNKLTKKEKKEEKIKKKEKVKQKTRENEKNVILKGSFVFA